MLPRPDIANAVKAVARYCSAPKLIHWKAARSILGYAIKTSSFGISFQKGTLTGVSLNFVRRCRLCFAQYGQEERVRGGSDVCRGACFVALQDAEVCDSLDYSDGVCRYVGHGEGDFVFEAVLVFYVAEG